MVLVVLSSTLMVVCHPYKKHDNYFSAKTPAFVQNELLMIMAILSLINSWYFA
jgi:hypothetical protein